VKRINRDKEERSNIGESGKARERGNLSGIQGSVNFNYITRGEKRNAGKA